MYYTHITLSPCIQPHPHPSTQVSTYPHRITHPHLLYPYPYRFLVCVVLIIGCWLQLVGFGTIESRFKTKKLKNVLEGIRDRGGNSIMRLGFDAPFEKFGARNRLGRQPRERTKATAIKSAWRVHGCSLECTTDDDLKLDAPWLVDHTFGNETLKGSFHANEEGTQRLAETRRDTEWGGRPRSSCPRRRWWSSRNTPSDPSGVTRP